jgi:DNA-binding PadR family transcriptional regulator
MAEDKGFWHDVRVGVAKDLIVHSVRYTLGLPVVLALVAAAVEPVRVWLLGDSHMPWYGVVLLVWLMLIALIGLARLAVLRYHARIEAGGSAPPDDASHAVPGDFNPTGVQLAAMGALWRRYDQVTSLATLNDELKLFTAEAGGKPFLAHLMEGLESANVVRIDETGRTDRSYHLTTLGRDWLLEQRRHAQEHPEGGPQPSGRETIFEPDADHQVALGLLMDAFPVTVSLQQLVDGMTHTMGVAGRLMTKAHAVHALDALIAAGAIEMVPSGNFSPTSFGRKLARDLAERGVAMGGSPEPPKFAPETFELTPARARALLVLDSHVSERMTLYNLHQLVVNPSPAQSDPRTSQGEVKRDMEDAEQAGYVSIDRSAGDAHYYKLTAEGLRWVIDNKPHLQTIGSQGLIKRNLRSSY